MSTIAPWFHLLGFAFLFYGSVKCLVETWRSDKQGWLWLGAAFALGDAAGRAIARAGEAFEALKALQ